METLYKVTMQSTRTIESNHNEFQFLKALLATEYCPDSGKEPVEGKWEAVRFSISSLFSDSFYIG